MQIKYKTTIGLEIHCQLATNSKLFCGCSTRSIHKINQNTCEVCLGLPGSLPVLNSKAVDFAIWFALAIGAKINPKTIFERKQYFYPDLPKGYQISQLQAPLCEGGQVILSNGRIIRVNRAHIEEDAGKSLHQDEQTLLDFNRAGTPLIEIVSEPDLESSLEASEYFKKIYNITTFLGITDGNLEEGSLRCDANVSIRPESSDILGTRCEIKNINSFRNLERAIEYEVLRQQDLLENHQNVKQATMGFDVSTGKTFVMREKEESEDYRYFPDPDLKPLFINVNRIEALKNKMPELPDQMLTRYITKYQVNSEDLYSVLFSKELKKLFDESQSSQELFDTKKMLNWLQTEVQRELNQNIQKTMRNIDGYKLATLLSLLEANKISGKIAKEVFKKMVDTGADPQTLLNNLGLKIIDDENILSQIIEDVLKINTKAVREYIEGQHKALGFLMGQVMQKTKGQADPVKAQLRLKLELDKLAEKANI